MRASEQIAVLLGTVSKPWIGLPGTVYFISKNATNGFAVGNDSNSAAQAQSKATPWASVSKAVATAANGSIFVINDDGTGTPTIYSGTELGASNFISLATKLFKIFAYNSGKVTFSSSAGAVTGLVRINNCPVAGVGIFNGIIFDGASLSTPVFVDDASGNTPALTFTNCTWQNPLNFANSITATKAAITFNNPTFAGTNRAFVNWQVLASPSSFLMSGGNVSLSNRTTQNDGVLNIKATTSGTSIIVDGSTLSGTINSGQTSGVFDIIRIFDVETVQVTNNVVNLLGHPGTCIGAPIRISPDTTIAMSVTVTGNTVYNESTGGYGVLVGTDGTGAGNNQANNCLIERNTISAVQANQSAPVHGIILGWSQGGTIRRNNIANCGHGIVVKASSGVAANVYSNIIIDAEYDYLYAKGSVNAKFANNTCYATMAATANTLGFERLGVGDDGTTYSTGCVFENNICYAANAAALKYFSFVDASSTATYNNNDYFLASGSLPANCFSYQGTTYSTVAAWAAAREVTALSGDPAFVSPGTNFNLGAGSAAKWAGVADANITVDYTGAAWHNPPSVGAYETA